MSIKLQRGIHVGMDREEVIHRIGLPAIEREINHIIFRADATVGGSVYRFDFSDGVLRSIRIQTTDWNDLAWNPAPYFDFVELNWPALTTAPKSTPMGGIALAGLPLSVTLTRAVTPLCLSRAAIPTRTGKR